MSSTLFNRYPSIKSTNLFELSKFNNPELFYSNGKFTTIYILLITNMIENQFQPTISIREINDDEYKLFSGKIMFHQLVNVNGCDTKHIYSTDRHELVRFMNEYFRPHQIHPDFLITSELADLMSVIPDNFNSNESIFNPYVQAGKIEKLDELEHPSNEYINPYPNLNINMILAMSTDNVIGVGQDIPWKLSPDMKYFKEKTMNSIVIMGTKTFESMGCKPLPGRYNIVIGTTYNEMNLVNMESVNKVLSGEYGKSTDIKSFKTIEEALNWCNDGYSKNVKTKEIFFMGGKRIYEEGLRFVNGQVHVTRVFKNIDENQEGVVKMSDEFFESLKEFGDRTATQIQTFKEIPYSFNVYTR